MNQQVSYMSIPRDMCELEGMNHGLVRTLFQRCSSTFSTSNSSASYSSSCSYFLFDVDEDPLELGMLCLLRLDRPASLPWLLLLGVVELRRCCDRFNNIYFFFSVHSKERRMRTRTASLIINWHCRGSNGAVERNPEPVMHINLYIKFSTVFFFEN